MKAILIVTFNVFSRLQLPEQSEVLRHDVEEELAGLLADDTVPSGRGTRYSTQSRGQCHRTRYNAEELTLAYRRYGESGRDGDAMTDHTSLFFPPPFYTHLSSLESLISGFHCETTFSWN
jgi:hypothetical protein